MSDTNTLQIIYESNTPFESSDPPTLSRHRYSLHLCRDLVE